MDDWNGREVGDVDAPGPGLDTRSILLTKGPVLELTFVVHGELDASKLREAGKGSCKLSRLSYIGQTNVVIYQKERRGAYQWTSQGLQGLTCGLGVICSTEGNGST